ncbi:hypothetical protein GCK72_013558 [Caenorhabditis remanei]|uniref:Uncharacterized protein n=1 Tax=Caenorhabditis remanei TaxID=31234 RepID=A0A6A5GR85_CAERE|nr:hypothetical protein GCK72_013558 [Caenorhabditis remanei]KAF1757103.1 hypothetical protein GCK72_013558 [Caenorhabditis remanei]
MNQSILSTSNPKLSNSVLEKIYEFWQQPENYKHVPVEIALELFNSNKIKMRELAWYLETGSNIPENFEDICKELVEKHFPQLIHEKEGMVYYNWYGFFQYCVYVQDDEDYNQQEEEHERKLKEYESQLTAMEMISAGTEMVQKIIENKRELMMTNPKKALKIVEPAQWIMYKRFNDIDRSKYQKEYIRRLSSNEEPHKAHFFAFEEVMTALLKKQQQNSAEKGNNKCSKTIPKKAKTIKKSETPVDLSFLKPYLSNDAVKRVEESVGKNSIKKGKVKKQENKNEVNEEVKEEEKALTVRDFLKMKKESRKSSMDILKKNREQPVEEFGSKVNMDCNNRKENIQNQ